MYAKEGEEIREGKRKLHVETLMEKERPSFM
jgi:hypothetical protein